MPDCVWRAGALFQSTLPTRGSDPCLVAASAESTLFQSTLPTRGSDQRFAVLRSSTRHVSIHAPHEGERPGWGRVYHYRVRRFNPRSPRGGATISASKMEKGNTVSIHAPHEGERRLHCASCVLSQSFNPRSPRGGATSTLTRTLQGTTGFNPRSPRGGATPTQSYHVRQCPVSIHAPHEGERHGVGCCEAEGCAFQSTLPTRGSDCLLFTGCCKGFGFNPRSPRGGATCSRCCWRGSTRRFNPRSPRGGATKQTRQPNGSRQFQSTLPTRGSDCKGFGRVSERVSVSIHAPHEGERQGWPLSSTSARRFNPRSPRGGATLAAPALDAEKQGFNPRSPRGGAT